LRNFVAYEAAKPVAALDFKDGDGQVRSLAVFNGKVVEIAANVADLHSDNNKINKETALDEKGMVVPGRVDTPNKHDIGICNEICIGIKLGRQPPWRDQPGKLATRAFCAGAVAGNSDQPRFAAW
jgi:hypothetical protein